MPRLKSRKAQARRLLYLREAGQRLRVTRLTLGLSEAEAAAAHGVGVRTYRQWEDGKTQATSFAVVRFAKKYDVSLDWLVCGEGFGIRAHLAEKSGGKLAILPVTSADRQRLLNQHREAI